MQHTLDSLSDRFCKVQVAFAKDSGVDLTKFENDRILSVKQSGSIYTVALAMGCDEAEKYLSVYNPVLVDYIPLTLEEIFIYELGGADYAVREVIL
jgi:ABC-2 type transport system ATP-binding protein